MPMRLASDIGVARHADAAARRSGSGGDCM